MEMNMLWAFFLFMSGAMAHRLLIRLMGLGIRSSVFKLTLINCIGLLKYVSLNAESFVNNFPDAEKNASKIETHKAAVEYWRELSIMALKTSVPAEVWKAMNVRDWKSAMLLVTTLERERNGKENN